MIYVKIEFVYAVTIDQVSLKKANLRRFRHPCVSSGECRLESMTLWSSVQQNLLSDVMAI